MSMSVSFTNTNPPSPYYYYYYYYYYYHYHYPQDVLASMKIGVLHADDIAEMAKAPDPADPYR
jgi:hypothetical protein